MQKYRKDVDAIAKLSLQQYRLMQHGVETRKRAVRTYGERTSGSDAEDRTMKFDNHHTIAERE